MVPLYSNKFSLILLWLSLFRWCSPSIGGFPPPPPPPKRPPSNDGGPPHRPLIPFGRGEAQRWGGGRRGAPPSDVGGGGVRGTGGPGRDNTPRGGGKATWPRFGLCNCGSNGRLWIPSGRGAGFGRREPDRMTGLSPSLVGNTHPRGPLVEGPRQGVEFFNSIHPLPGGRAGSPSSALRVG